MRRLPWIRMVHGMINGACSPGAVPLWRSLQANQVSESVKFILAQGLGKAVSHLPVSGDILQCDVPGGNLFAHVVVLYVNVFGTCMELGVLSQCHCSLVVAIDDHSFGGLVTGIELIQKTTQLHRFFGGLRLADILGFTG